MVSDLGFRVVFGGSGFRGLGLRIQGLGSWGWV